MDCWHTKRGVVNPWATKAILPPKLNPPVSRSVRLGTLVCLSRRSPNLVSANTLGSQATTMQPPPPAVDRQKLPSLRTFSFGHSSSDIQFRHSPSTKIGWPQHLRLVALLDRLIKAFPTPVNEPAEGYISQHQSWEIINTLFCTEYSVQICILACDKAVQLVLLLKLCLIWSLQQRER